MKDREAAILLKRTGPEDSRSRAEAMHQLGVAQAYAIKVIESDVSQNKALADLRKRKKNLEKLGQATVSTRERRV